MSVNEQLNKLMLVAEANQKFESKSQHLVVQLHKNGKIYYTHEVNIYKK